MLPQEPGVTLRRLLASTVLVAVLAGTSVAHAHDFWLMPSRLVLRDPGPVDVSLFLGERLVAEEEKAQQAERTVRFFHASSKGEAALALPEGSKPILRQRVLAPGGNLFVLERSPAFLELQPAKFHAYLKEESLDWVVAERERLGEANRPGRETYSRSLETFIQVGSVRDEVFAAGADTQLAIVPQSHPSLASAGSSLRVKLLLRGAPLAGAKLTALRRDKSGALNEVAHTTDAQGNVDVVIDAEGVWLLRTVHMERCQGCEKADWQSTWASYSFAVGDGSRDVAGLLELGPAHTHPTATLPPGTSGCACGFARSNDGSLGLLVFALAALGLQRRAITAQR